MPETRSMTTKVAAVAGRTAQGGGPRRLGAWPCWSSPSRS